MSPVRELVPQGVANPGGNPTLIDADELCVLAGRTVTHMYRTAHSSAGRVDAAHGRVWNATRGRGTVDADDLDVALILAAAAVTR